MWGFEEVGEGTDDTAAGDDDKWGQWDSRTSVDWDEPDEPQKLREWDRAGATSWRDAGGADKWDSSASWRDQGHGSGADKWASSGSGASGRDEGHSSASWRDEGHASGAEKEEVHERLELREPVNKRPQGGGDTRCPETPPEEPDPNKQNRGEHGWRSHGDRRRSRSPIRRRSPSGWKGWQKSPFL